MKILLIGDIVGKPGRNAIVELLPPYIEQEGIDFIIANAENTAGGLGLTPKLAEQLFSSKIDLLTGGNHIWKRKDIYPLLEHDKRIIRPANYPSEEVPGRGWVVLDGPGDTKIGVITLLGRVFMRSVECPFKTAEKLVEKIRNQTKIIFVEIHAEATSEKIALGRFLDGKVTAVYGTHTHVQTSDEQIFPHRTAYITDLGMTGPHDSVIGREVDAIIKHFITQLPVEFTVAHGDVHLEGAVVTLDPVTGIAQNIERVRLRMEE